MTSLISKFAVTVEQDWKQFWDGKVKPEIKVLESALENVQKELQPIEEAALKAIAAAGFTAAAGASGGVVPASIEAAIPCILAGAKAALAQASVQGVSLSHQAAVALIANASVPLPVVSNGANG